MSGGNVAVDCRQGWCRARCRSNTGRCNMHVWRQLRPQRTHAVDVQSRNRVLVEAHEFEGAGERRFAAGAHIALPRLDPRAQHLLSVLRAQPSDTIKVGLIGGPRACAEVTALPKPGQDFVCLRITEVQPPLPRLPVDLLLALPRPKVLRRLWPVIGELGPRSVVLTGAARVEKSFWAASTALDPAQIRNGLIKGLEQAGATMLPDVVLSRTLKGAVMHLAQRAQEPACPEPATSPADLPWGVGYAVGSWQGSSMLPRLVDLREEHAAWHGMVRMVAHPDPSAPPALHVLGKTSGLATQPGGRTGVVVAVGPEGGWWPEELELLEQGCGFVRVALGPRVLTTTSAVISMLAIVQQYVLMRGCETSGGVPAQDASADPARTPHV